jgi:beta-glucosidase/6-phospho-beta-glucosidase/beta-galactosidase
VDGSRGLAPSEGFLWGVAYAGFHVEGGFNGRGEPQNNWADQPR